jgi:CRISPR-associated protein Cas2
VIVVVLSICPERLRGVLTRWLLEISTGVYVGHVPARVRDRLWLRIIEDVGKGRALMVHSTSNEQRLSFRVHNHGWQPVDIDGLTLMRRPTAESRALARGRAQESAPATPAGSEGVAETPAGLNGETQGDGMVDSAGSRRNWSKAARRRRFRNAVEKRHDQ